MGRMSNPAVYTMRLADLEARIKMQPQLSFLLDQFDFDQPNNSYQQHHSFGPIAIMSSKCSETEQMARAPYFTCEEQTVVLVGTKIS